MITTVLLDASQRGKFEVTTLDMYKYCSGLLQRSDGKVGKVGESFPASILEGTRLAEWEQFSETELLTPYLYEDNFELTIFCENIDIWKWHKEYTYSTETTKKWQILKKQKNKSGKRGISASNQGKSMRISCDYRAVSGSKSSPNRTVRVLTETRVFL